MNEKRVCQSADDSLSNKGNAHAQQVAEALKNEHYDRIFVSTMQRAIETSEKIIVHQKDTPVEYEDKIREQENGKWIGKSYDYRDTERKRIASEKNIGFWQVIPEEGESMEDSQKRCVKFIENLLKKEYESVLIISHGTVILYMLQHLLGFDMSESKSYSLRPCEYSIVEATEGKSKLILSKVHKNLEK
ncbi:histidine phosphatase family protein [Candidatus Woesearchaeota archaeon]|nr:histidine phosphatase family protein [Candidatus Woesearchaeota archaeon]